MKSLGTPDQPTKTSTAIQLEAGPGQGNEITWTLARWALRMKSDSSFPVTAAGVGVPSPGLYQDRQGSASPGDLDRGQGG